MASQLDLTRPPLPQNLQIEVTGACNLRCRMCIVRYRPTLGRSASMSFAEFRRLLDQVPTVTDVTLQGIGEPLMAPDIFKMIAYATERGVRAGFNTNATLLTLRAAERLLDAGVDWLCFSLDGARKETYEFVRDQSRWETVERNISRFAGLMQERGLDRPALSLVMVLMQHNLHDLPELVRQAAAWRIPQVFVQGLSHDFSDAPGDAYTAIADFVGGQRLAASMAPETEDVFEEARRVAEREGIKLRLPSIAAHTTRYKVEGIAVGCDWPWNGSYVTYDGTVKPCCMVMGSERGAVGSLQANSFAEIWSGDELRAFRARLLEGGEPPAICRGCSLYRGTF